MFAAALVVVLAVGGCTSEDPRAGGGDGQRVAPGPNGTLRVLAGSELADLEQTVLPEIRAATGVAVHLDYVGTLDGRPDVVGVAREQLHDLRERGEGVRVGRRRREARQLCRPVRRVEVECVPARRAPRLADAAPLQNDVLHPEARQVVARREPRLARADDDAVDHARSMSRTRTSF